METKPKSLMNQDNSVEILLDHYVPVLLAAKKLLALGDGGENEFANFIPSKFYDPLRDAIGKCEGKEAEK